MCFLSLILYLLAPLILGSAHFTPIHVRGNEKKRIFVTNWRLDITLVYTNRAI